MIGEVLLDRYEILEKTGDGGMAIVYRAKDTLLNRIVAVKVLRDQFASDDEFIERFRREAQAAASLSHPHVVNIYDVGHTRDTHFIVMEYVEGSNLSEIIKEQGSLEEPAVIRLSMQIASALAHAHQHGIVHRDIKPHNILITREGQVKVTDFGIAAISSANLTETGMVLGSVHYFSPEQAKGQVVDAQSDLYSLGIVMYEMLTGKVPFRGDAPVSVALKHIQEEPLSVRTLNPHTSEGLAAITAKLLEKKARDRYHDADAVVSSLDELERSEQTQKLPAITGQEEVEQTLPPRKARKKNVPKKARRSRLYPIVIILTVFSLSLWAAQRILPRILFPQDVSVPSIVGLSFSEAEASLQRHQLLLGVDREVFDNQVEANHIISQEPSAGRVVKEGRTILVRLSKGPEYVDMISVEGLSPREARLNLTQSGFTLGEERTVFDTAAAANTVVGQDPEPGQRTQKGTAVNLVVNVGHESQAVIGLPDFRGSSLQTAQQRLIELGLTVGSTWPEYSTTIPEEEIIAQNPSPGTEVELGWAVDFVYSQGLPRSGTTSPQGEPEADQWTTERVQHSAQVSIAVPDGPSQEVVILVVDDFGVREVYRQTHRGGSRIAETVQGRGIDAKIQVYIGGRMFVDKLFKDLD